MLRLDKKALEERDGKVFYKGDLFSGVAFIMNEGEMINAVEVYEGIEIGKYFPRYLPISGCKTVDIELLNPENEEDYEAFLCLNDERFTGVALEFDGVFCTGELLYINGWSDSQVTYYKTGNIESIELIEDGFSQIYQWSEEGEVKKYEITLRNLFSFNLELDEDGGVSVLGMEGDYFNNIKLVSDKLIIPPIKDESFLSVLKASSFISISGDFITDNLLEELVINSVLDNTESISFYQTSITKESLYVLKNKRIRKIFINSNSITLDEINVFKSNSPSLYVEFDCGEELA